MLENLLGDQVDSCNLLEALVDDPQTSPSKVLRTTTSEKLSQPRALVVLVTTRISRSCFDFYSFTDGMIRPLDFKVIEWFIIQSRNNSHSFGIASVFHEPRAQAEHLS